jgi:hypothetical protein
MARRSLGAVLAAAMLTVALGAQAVLGVSVHNVTGKVGAWSALDDPGAKCIYSSKTGRLRAISVRPPTFVNGAHSDMTWVGWRFQVVEPVEFERGRLIYKSRTWKAQASDSVSADAFARAKWYLPKGMKSAGGYHVYPIIVWYAPGSKVAVEGKAFLGYDHYRLKKGSKQYRGFGYCSDRYGGTPSL